MEVMQKLDFELKFRPAIAVVALFLILWFTPCPEGIDPKGWKVLAVFAATILGLLTKPMPMGATVMLAITVLAVTRTLPLGEALSGFSNSSVWLIVMAFFISRGLIKTGFGNRIGYMFIKRIGHTTLGLAYALTFTQYVLGPATPSSTARSGGILCPLTLSLAKVYGSDPALGTERKIGAYLMFVSFVTNYPICAAFLTSMAANPLAVAMAEAQGVVGITWLSWAWAALFPVLAATFVLPIVVYWVYPPEIKHSPEARQMAVAKLKEMGPMSRSEIMMLIAFLGMLLLWVVGSFFKLDATVAAFIGIMFLVYSGVLTWSDILSEKGAWDCLVWFAGLILMAGCLNKYGVIPYLGNTIGAFASGFSWPVAMFIILVACMYGGYCVASTTAFVTATYSVFLSIALAAGVPGHLAALLIIWFPCVQAVLTYYSAGPGPIYMAHGYIESTDWLKVGFVCSLAQFLTWIPVGAVWWKIIGLY